MVGESISLAVGIHGSSSHPAQLRRTITEREAAHKSLYCSGRQGKSPSFPELNDDFSLRLKRLILNIYEVYVKYVRSFELCKNMKNYLFFSTHVLKNQ